MATNTDLLDDMERSQREATRRRRKGRSRRYRRMVFAAVGFFALLILAAPSLVSHSGMAQSMLVSQAAEYGWAASAESIDVGWITPLKIRNLELTGQSKHTSVKLAQIDTSLTVTQLMRMNLSEIGEITIRDARLSCAVAHGASSLESDLAMLLEPSSEETNPVLADVSIQEIRASITDTATGETWVIDQSNLEMRLDGSNVSGDLSGVITEPNGNAGALQTHFAWHPSEDQHSEDQHSEDQHSEDQHSEDQHSEDQHSEDQHSEDQHSEDQHSDAQQSSHQTLVSQASRPANETLKQWELSLTAESFPMSILNLVMRRAGDAATGVPSRYSGDTTGQLRMIGGHDGAIQASLNDVRIRSLQTSIASIDVNPSESWTNELATIDGQVSLADDWLFGYGLKATTDFASATIDGAFPTKMTLTGSQDNPISWLQSLDGTARVDIDLVAFDRALPGLIPLRDDAQLVQGRATAVIENTAVKDNSASKRSKLTVRSESLRARSKGRPVIIEPIELSGLVVTDGQQIRAETFAINSQFATASGAGSLRDGQADFKVDFGRLTAMLRPIIDFSDTSFSDVSLGGTANGRVTWKITPASQKGVGERWKLDGDGQAEQLLVTLPGGHRFKRAIVKGKLSAVGQYDNHALKELTSAEIAIHSGGVAVRAQLLSPVADPTVESMFPVELSGDARLENLAESLKPWIPDTIRDAEGRIVGNAIAKLSTTQGTLSQATFDLSRPRFGYANQWYSQPNLKVDFQGALDWPSGRFRADTCTVAGEAISLAVQGEMDANATQLEVAWKANLERLQESVGATVARAKTSRSGSGASSRQANVRPISYRPVQTQSHRIQGLCDGRSTITHVDGGWRFDSKANFSNLAVYAPPASSASPPGTPRFGSARLSESSTMPIWTEPRLVLRGPIEVVDNGKTIKLNGVTSSNDWFDGTLTGVIRSTDETMTAQLHGPTRCRMNVLAELLTSLFGTPVNASGIHESEMKLTYTSSGNDPAEFEIQGEMGWDACQVLGVSLGRSSLPFKLTQQKLSIAPCTVPLQSVARENDKAGSLQKRPILTVDSADAALAKFSADVYYGRSPMAIRVHEGARLDGLQITPEHAATWLQYLAPVAAGATRIDGVVGAEVDELLINLDDPITSSMRGRLNVQRLNLSSGPLADQLIQGIEQIKSIAGQSNGIADSTSPKTLIEMPPQNVDFVFADGIATHQRMYFQIDRAQLITSGQVDVNSNMQMIAQLPLDPRWLGNDLQGLLGESITLPINGTLSKPELDVSAVRQIMTQFGIRAGQQVIEKRVDGFLQKQLGSGFDRINEQLESGLGKILDF